jgi:hypothetical protein
MRRRFAILLITGVVLVGAVSPASAANRDSVSSKQPVREFFLKAVKQVKNILHLAPAEDYPLPPRP